ncbi:acyl-CoA carboxylase epsilon subunit [Saccharothrix australiensis]|uniref:Acyl-CoA carboxylase epsilon subunit-like protein n=1 Tax=Saccharothrix australiensis TaxID=2072 RepID=A0A495VYM9_9PSEU|nr:acyl-CoA carboxylase epsilon subunit [Saccharothrix australiensis]RKT54531.1 acyl-CoA carboxylase epsilon subunit-like protein [Saccharothrix australiensis]
MTSPAFRVLKGEPTDEELAALAIALLVRAATEPPPAPVVHRPTWLTTTGYTAPTSWAA